MSETLVRQTAYRTVHLPQGQDYGMARINGHEVPVTEEYLNSKETRSYLELNRKRFHKSTLNFLESVDNLDRIEESKVYLCITDDKGEPLYRTWESFLKAETSLDRSTVCKIRAARNGYRWLKKTHEGKKDRMLALLPRNMNFYYQLEQIPENQRESALQTVLEHQDGNAVTAKALEQWRKSSKAIPAHMGAEGDVRAESPVVLPETVQDDEESPSADMPANVECSEVDSLPETVQPPDICILSDEQKDTTIKTAITSDTCVEEKASELQRWETGKEINTFEGYSGLLIEILQNVEYQKLVAEDAIKHSDSGDLKHGESTVRERIDNAIADFKRGVNAAQLKIREQMFHDGHGTMISASGEAVS